MASVRERPPGSGRWQARIYTGKDPLTGKPIYVPRTFDAPNKREAKRIANGIENELRDGERTHGQGGTFEQLCDDYMADRAAKGLMTPSSLRATRTIIDAYLRRHLGTLQAADIRVHTLDRFYAELVKRGGRCQHRPCRRPRNCGVDGHARECRRKACIESWVCPVHAGACAAWTPCEESPCEHGGPLAVSSVARIHNVVRAILEQGRIWGWYRHNHAEHANPGRVVVEETDPPDDPDIIRILAKAEEQDERLATYLALAIEAGPRRGAEHASRWTYWSGPLCPVHSIMAERSGDSFACVHCGELEGAISTIRFPKVISIGPDGPVEMPASNTKRSGRKVTLGLYVTAALVRHHDDMFERALSAGGVLPADAFMFSNDVQGAKPWRPEHTSRRFKQVTRAVNLDDETQLRHLRDLMATKLLSARVSPKVVGERGGWQKLATMLDRYAHVVPADDAQAAGVVDRILRPDR